MYVYRYALDSGPFSQWIMGPTTSFTIATPEEGVEISLQAYATDFAGNRTDIKNATLIVAEQSEPSQIEIEELEEESDQPGNPDERFASLRAVSRTSSLSSEANAASPVVPVVNECKPHANNPHFSTSQAQLGKKRIKGGGFVWCGPNMGGNQVALGFELFFRGPEGNYYLLPESVHYYPVTIPEEPFKRVFRSASPVRCINGSYYLTAIIRPEGEPVDPDLKWGPEGEAFHRSQISEVHNC
jgi:hypothetical protein